MYLKVSNPMDYRVGLYVRISREDENEGPSESVANQLSLLTGFAKSNSLSVFDTYVDDGWSGTSFDRPNFNRLVADIEAKKVNMVVTKDLSRLGRDYIMTGHYIERFFPEHQVRYVSLLDGVDTGVDSSVNDVTPFRALMNDMYAKDISKKIKSVKRDKQRRGLFIGGKPVYGYKPHPAQKNRIVVDEDAAPIVRSVFGMALQGVSCRQIAAALNAARVPTPAAYAGIRVHKPGPYAGMWSGERISDMLANETYIGNMVQGRTRKISYKTKKCVKQAPEDWIVVEGTHEPLVAPDDFQKVRELVGSRRHTRSRTYEYPLKGLVYCRECGFPMAAVNRKKPGGEDCLYFICRTYQRCTKAGVCTCHSIKEETVTRHVAQALEGMCRQYIRRGELVSLAERFMREAIAARDGDEGPDVLTAKIAALTFRLDKVYGDRLSGLLAEGDFARVYQKISLERASLEKRLEKRAAEIEKPAERPAQAETLADQFLSSIGSNRELLASLIERVEYSEEKELCIRFKFLKPEGMETGA